MRGAAAERVANDGAVRHCQQGFALPVALLALLALTALATAGFLGSLIDLRSAEAQAAGNRAWLAAVAGLETALGRGSDARLPLEIELESGDSARVGAAPLLPLQGGASLWLLAADGSARIGPRGRARRGLRTVLLVADPDSVPPGGWERPGARFELFPP